jgi:hypothetical protein
MIMPRNLKEIIMNSASELLLIASGVLSLKHMAYSTYEALAESVDIRIPNAKH